MDDNAVQRCEDLWLNGGDIVIRAENTVFKVLAAILSIASPIFKDMFGLPQPPVAGTEMYEGIPLVRLPDSAFEVTQFLKALIYPGYAQREILHRLAVLAAVLRLGTKYGVAYLREIAVVRLVQLFPHTFTAYLQIEDLDQWPYRDSTRRQGALIGVILARECNVPAVLPCCLFIWTPSFGGDISRFSPESSEAHLTLEDGRRYTLDLDTYSLCLRVGWQLSELRQRLILDALSSVVCPDDSCRSEATRSLMDYQILRRETEYDPGALLCLLEDLGSGWWMYAFGICVPCGEEAASIWMQGCGKAWEKFPEYYGLSPSWEELVAATQLVAEHGPLL